MKAVATRRLKAKHNVKVTGSRSKVSSNTPANNEKASLKITESQGNDISNIPSKSSKTIRSQGEEDLLDSFKLSDDLVLFEVHDAESSFAPVEENRPDYQYSESKIGLTSLANNNRMVCDMFAADEACADNYDDLDGAIVDVFLDDVFLDEEESLDGVLLDVLSNPVMI